MILSPDTYLLSMYLFIFSQQVNLMKMIQNKHGSTWMREATGVGTIWFWRTLINSQDWWGSDTVIFW